jgi:uncharacterized protein (TIGR03067 family)
MSATVARSGLAWLMLMVVCAAADPEKSAESPQDRVKKDVERLQGKWQLASVEQMGEKNEAQPDNPLVFKETRISDKDEEVATFKLEAGTDFDIIDIKLIQADRTLEGIYALKDDEFKLCVFVGDGAKQRPSKFTSEGDFAILILKRLP